MAKKRVHRPEGARPTTQTARSPRSTSPAPPPPAPSGPRARLESASRPILTRMRALPTFLMPMLLAVMLFLGLAISAPWAGILLVLIGLFLAWLTALSWPATTPGSRALRIVVNVSVLSLGVLKLLGVI